MYLHLRPGVYNYGWDKPLFSRLKKKQHNETRDNKTCRIAVSQSSQCVRLLSSARNRNPTCVETGKYTIPFVEIKVNILFKKPTLTQYTLFDRGQIIVLTLTTSFIEKCFRSHIKDIGCCWHITELGWSKLINPIGK